MIIYMPLP